VCSVGNLELVVRFRIEGRCRRKVQELKSQQFNYLPNVKSRDILLTVTIWEFIINMSNIRSMVFLRLYENIINNRIFHFNQQHPMAALQYVQCEILKQYLIGTTYGPEFLCGGESVQVSMPVYSQFL